MTFHAMPQTSNSERNKLYQDLLQKGSVQDNCRYANVLRWLGIMVSISRAAFKPAGRGFVWGESRHFSSSGDRLFGRSDRLKEFCWLR
ncbi:hypothetical protein XELAEV_18036242mg [Xenopus laevis]|uniref:Uncharacterized protein n=1 Tax=Xenopus laevis TaxID=8355 RepID=A0A974HDA8_XENLA|nr:hypothetical protein XELAEV_18036242mg [Xenopus laevis]